MDLRCPSCVRHPLLAVVLRDDSGRPYVHVKIHKQSRVFGEVVVTEGECYLRCRECNRWLKLKVQKADVNFDPATLPEGYELLS